MRKSSEYPQALIRENTAYIVEAQRAGKTISWTPYGCYIHGKPQIGTAVGLSSNRSRIRIDIFVPGPEYTHEGDRPRDNWFFCESLEDDSPAQSEYHPECSCCWLNIPHTEKRHSKNLEHAKTLIHPVMLGGPAKAEKDREIA